MAAVEVSLTFLFIAFADGRWTGIGVEARHLAGCDGAGALRDRSFTDFVLGAGGDSAWRCGRFGGDAGGLG